MSDATTPSFPAGRYGTGSPVGSNAGGSRSGGGLSRRARAAIAAALAAAVALVAWLAVEQSRNDPVSYDVVGFDVVDAEQVDVTFQVHMPPGTTAVCTVEALSDSYAQVGTIDVAVGPSERRTSRHTVTVRTSELATTGVVERCDVSP